MASFRLRWVPLFLPLMVRDHPQADQCGPLEHMDHGEQAFTVLVVEQSIHVRGGRIRPKSIANGPEVGLRCVASVG